MPYQQSVLSIIAWCIAMALLGATDTTLAHQMHLPQAFSQASQASHTRPSGTYKIHETEHYVLVYDEAYSQAADYIVGNMDKFLAHQEQHFDITLRGKLYLVLSNDDLQFANGYATQIPFNKIQMFNGGRLLGNYFNSNWLDALLIHEIAHAYQLNTGENVISESVAAVSNNQPMSLFGIIPLLQFPNAFVSLMFIEGSAVVNESRYNLGGRLISSHYRAMLHVLAREGALSLDRLHLKFDTFPLDYPYVIGALFWNYLGETYGYDTTDRFFKLHGQHNFFHFMYGKFDQTFIRLFGKSLATLHAEFVADAERQAQGFTRTQFYRRLSTQSSWSPVVRLSKQDGVIRVLEVGDLRNPPILHSFDTSSNSYQQETTTLLHGQVFRVDERIYSVSANSESSNRIIAGLYDSDFAPSNPVAKGASSSAPKVIIGFTPKPLMALAAASISTMSLLTMSVDRYNSIAPAISITSNEKMALWCSTRTPQPYSPSPVLALPPSPRSITITSILLPILNTVPGSFVITKAPSSVCIRAMILLMPA